MTANDLDEKGRPGAPDVAASGVESVTPEAVRAELARICGSASFRSATRLKEFLSFVVEQTLAGRARQIKEYSIGLEVFHKDESFDPRKDPIVRVEASKLRTKLALYYQSGGAQDPVRIELPKRGYAPILTGADPSAAAVKPPRADLVSVPPPLSAVHSPRGYRWRFAAVVLGVVMAAMLLIPSLLKERARSSNDADSIAVMPLVNLGDNKTDEYFSDGLTDELIVALGRIPSLRVVARASVFQYKGKPADVREVGRQLNVGSVLEGSVERGENRLRLTVHLDDARTGYRRWSATYERGVQDALRVQQEIAQAVTSELGVELARNQPLSTASNRPAALANISSEAYQDYLKGLYFWNKNSASSILTAINYFDNVIRSEPKFAPAYTGLGRCYTALPVFTSTQSLEVVPKIRNVASKALALDPTSGEAHLQLGEASFLEYDWGKAEKELNIALKLSPNDAVVHRWRSYYFGRMGREEAALAENLSAQALDPVSAYIADGVASSYMAMRKYDEAIQAYKKALALEPYLRFSRMGIGLAYLFAGRSEEGIKEMENVARDGDTSPAVEGELGYAYAVLGRRPRAQAILARLLDEARNRSAHAYHVAEVYVGLDDRNNAFTWLGKAVDEHEISLALKDDAKLDPLRGDPRFQDLLRRMKLF
jgi:TolB-like protein